MARHVSIFPTSKEVEVKVKVKVKVEVEGEGGGGDLYILPCLIKTNFHFNEKILQLHWVLL
jgi:hypothetical protein